MIVFNIFITVMKTPRKRKNIKKKNYGSPSIPKELTYNKWWQLVYKLKGKEKQAVFNIF